MKFTKHVNAATREIRILVTDGSWYGIQVFFRDGAATGDAPDNTAKLFIRTALDLTPSEEDFIVTKVAQEIVHRLSPKMLITAIPTFEDYLSVVDG